MILTGMEMVSGRVNEGKLAPKTYFLIPFVYMSWARKMARISVSAITTMTKPSLTLACSLLITGVKKAPNRGIAIRRAGE